MELPAKYNYTIYKFHLPKPLSEKQFIRNKSIEKSEYLKKIKHRIKKEKMVFFRHHGISLIAFWISILLGIISVLLFLISSLITFDSIFQTNQLRTTISICAAISIAILIILHIRRFPLSFLSFRSYVKEKYNYYFKLKENIDSCEDFFIYRKHFPE